MDSIAAIVKTILFVMAALLPIMNPPGVAPIFLAMTNGASEAARRQLARRIALNLFFLLLAAVLIGSHVLAFFGISLPVVKVGGGLVVIANAWDLLRSDEPGQRTDGPAGEAREAERLSRLAFYPIAFPLTVGPGTLSIAVTLGASVQASGVAVLEAMVGSLIGLIGTAVVAYYCYGFAAQILRLLGDTGTTVLLRLSAFILLCIGVQILWGGLSELTMPMLAQAR